MPEPHEILGGKLSQVTGLPGGIHAERITFPPKDHPAGCFFGSFGGYADAWHIPRGAVCELDHGEDPIQLQ